MRGRTLKILALIAFVLLWAFLGHHYYSCLASYAALNYHVKKTLLYMMTELFWLWCVTILTYLGVKALEWMEED